MITHPKESSKILQILKLRIVVTEALSPTSKVSFKYIQVIQIFLDFMGLILYWSKSA